VLGVFTPMMAKYSHRTGATDRIVLYPGKLSRNASAVSDAPRSEGAGRLRVSVQLFEGSRPWGGDYVYSIVLGLGEKLGEQLLEPEKAKRGLVWW